jgi:uncharacterized protein (DUF58 family)
LRIQFLGTLLIVTSMTFAVAGVLFQSMPFVLLCCAFAASLVYARSKFIGEIRSTDLQVTRVLSDELPFAGQPLSVDVRILNAGPTTIDCVLEDMIPEDCEIAAGTNVHTGVVPSRSQLTISYTVVPKKRKTYVFPGVKVEVEDEYGLFVHESMVESTTTLSVHTSKESLDRARKLAGKEHLEYSGLSRHIAMVMYDLEFDNIREYMPGDRSRDVHWKLLSKLDDLYTKVYTREGVVQTMIFVDCSRSMRMIGSGLGKMDHSIDLSMQISKVLLSSFHATGVCLLDELSVLSQVPPGVGRRQFDRIVESLRKVPPAVSFELPEAPPPQTPSSDEPPAPPVAEAEGGDSGEGGVFLSIVRSLGRGSVDRSSGIGFDGVVRNLLTKSVGRKLMMIVITDMLSSRDAILSGARFCGRKGSKLVVLHLCGDWYRERDQPLDTPEVEKLYEDLMGHIELEGKLRRAGAAYLRIGPADTTAAIVRAMRLGRV